MTKTLTTSSRGEVTLASRLQATQREIALLQEDEKVLKQELMRNLKQQHVKAVRLDDGSQYIISERQTLKIKDEDKAQKWLDDNYCWKPDTAKALKLLRRSLKKPPAFFSISKTEYLVVKKGTEDVEETD